MRVLLAVIAWLALGAPTAAALLRRKRRDLAVCALPLAANLAVMLPWMLSAATHQPVRAWQFVAAAVLLWGVAEVLLGPGREPRTGVPSEPARQNRYLVAAAAGLVLLAAAGSICAGIYLAGGFPGYGWDAYMIWLLHAKVLAQTGGFPWSIATEPSLSPGHWDYPLLLPSVLAWFATVGNVQIHQMSIALGILAAVLTSAGWVGLHRRLGAGWAAAVVLSPWLVREMLRYHFAAYADPLMVMQMVIALAMGLHGAIGRRRGALLVGALAIAGTVATKNEGALWLVACSVALGLVSLEAGGGLIGSASTVFLWAAPAAVLFVLWRWICAGMGLSDYHTSHMSFVYPAQRSVMIARYAWQESVSEPATLALLCASIVGMLAFSRCGWYLRLRRVAVLSAGPIVYSAGIFVIYLGTPYPLQWHLITSGRRVLFGVVPALFVCAAFARHIGRRTCLASGESRI